jgi:hypothetical protein
MPQRYHIGALLNIVPGALCSESGIDDVYELLGYLTGDRGLMTHQLPSAARIAEPYLIDQHPWLKDVPDHGGYIKDSDTARKWRQAMAILFGEWHEVEALPAEAWGTHDPIADLAEMVGVDRVIVVEAP